MNQVHEQRKILVLSDGKPGHYNQSLGIIDRMDNVYVETIHIKFKSKFRDNLLRIMAWITAGGNLPGKIIKSILRWAMENSSADDLLNSDGFDAVLSTGSSVAAPNLFIGRFTGVKPVVCTRPSPVGISHFHLAILPEHSRPRKIPENVVMTIGVPNRITPDQIKLAGENLGEKLSVSQSKIIAVLLGGDDPYYYISPELSSTLWDLLNDICLLNGYQLIITTSRRTNPDTESVIASKSKDSSHCILCILASEPQDENPVPGMLGLSEVIVVTEDSFSMVCEAASSGKKVVILEVERRKKSHPKRQKVYDMLVEKGYTVKADLSNLQMVLTKLIKDDSESKILDDARTAAVALKKLMDEFDGKN